MARGASQPGPEKVFAPLSGIVGSILLETRRPDVRDRYSYIFRDPVAVLSTSRTDEVPALLEEAGVRRRNGSAVAGFVSYEAGFSLDRAFPRTESRRSGFPLVWLGVYEGFLRFDHLRAAWERDGACPPAVPECDLDAGPRPFEGTIEPRFSIPWNEYAGKVREIRRAIARGDLYQANLTGSFSFPFADDPYSLYLRLRDSQPVKYGAFLRPEAGCIVSLSPELFFRVRGDRIETRPMKGTAPRGLTEREDRRAAAALRTDPKNRAENIMIVDLLRNDLGRVCRPGTVRATCLFEVQRYRTVLQMVSTVSGELLPGSTPASLFRALFPCGSVTGAPKISAVRLLRRLESSPRGVYTGAIGVMLPSGDMTFSVAIRTVAVRDGVAEAGAGGGIVWDSTARGELEEARLKGRYLAEPPLSFDLIETFCWSAGGGFRFLDDHLRRLASSARYFGFRFRKAPILAALESAVRDAGSKSALRIRLLLDRGGEASVETTPMTRPRDADDAFRFALSTTAVSSRDPFARHKTTNRLWRDEELRRAREAGFDEILFFNERGELAEGAITNVFLEIDGTLVTPPPSSGLLEGVFRKRVLRERPRQAVERVLFREDLGKASAIYLTNSVRGMIRAGRPPDGGLQSRLAGPRDQKDQLKHREKYRH